VPSGASSVPVPSDAATSPRPPQVPTLVIDSPTRPPVLVELPSSLDRPLHGTHSAGAGSPPVSSTSTRGATTVQDAAPTGLRRSNRVSRPPDRYVPGTCDWT
jgi:hypothetical protein